ncbi:OmpA family protein [Conservatibacter flavescens]|uniref:Plastocyanin n=1 Tax=Conservatibacter flavescens TaxID=28161 RepID=A0A2M8S440_9PAST|nr:OmpA family protein [Conservatibacter flavescens]PJG85916.1 plastocyanin [Conservatibacter flavescens]
MKKINILTALFAIVLTGCGNLSQVKQDGTTDNPVWPTIESAGINQSGTQEGIWPNWDNVNQIEKGMNKAQLYYLLGEPHYNEGMFAVREWNYVFNYREKGEHKICQFKVLFDHDMNAQSFYWKPAGCRQSGDNTGVGRYELSGDFLFDFNSASLSEQGRMVLDSMVNNLHLQDKTVMVEGFTDRLGSDAYNRRLSQRRADAVKMYFMQKGMKDSQIIAVGRGKEKQVIACEHQQGQALKDCLRPNRRVALSVL